MVILDSLQTAFFQGIGHIVELLSGPEAYIQFGNIIFIYLLSYIAALFKLLIAGYVYGRNRKALPNILFGMGGDDFLFGGGGNDWLATDDGTRALPDAVANGSITSDDLPAASGEVRRNPRQRTGGREIDVMAAPWPHRVPGCRDFDSISPCSQSTCVSSVIDGREAATSTAPAPS